MCLEESSRRLTGASIRMSGVFAERWATPSMARNESRAFAASDICMPFPAALASISLGAMNGNEKPVPKDIPMVLDGIRDHCSDAGFRSGDHSLQRSDDRQSIALYAPGSEACRGYL